MLLLLLELLRSHWLEAAIAVCTPLADRAVPEMVRRERDDGDAEQLKPLAFLWQSQQDERDVREG